MIEFAKINSYKKTARFAGIFGLIIIVCGVFSEAFVRSRLIVHGDAIATANNIMSSEWLFRIGFASEIIVFLSDVVMTVLLYILFKPVSEKLALLAAFFRLVMTAILGINLLNQFFPLLILSGAEYLNVFETSQLYALVLLFLNAYGYGYSIGLVFFGFHCAVLGYLILKANYFPSILGGLLILASLCYITGSFTFFLFPEYVAMIFPEILLPSLVAALSLSLWLLLKGLKVKRTH
jgi:Domain of unknown function (DUF4386)